MRLLLSLLALGGVFGRRIIAIGDLHGDIDVLNEILVHSRVCSYGKENALICKAPRQKTTILHVGDLFDRGAHGDKLMNVFDELNLVERIEVVQLLGNHELMNMGGDFSMAAAEELGFPVNIASLPYSDLLMNDLDLVQKLETSIDTMLRKVNSDMVDLEEAHSVESHADDLEISRLEDRILAAKSSDEPSGESLGYLHTILEELLHSKARSAETFASTNKKLEDHRKTLVFRMQCMFDWKESTSNAPLPLPCLLSFGPHLGKYFLHPMRERRFSEHGDIGSRLRNFHALSVRSGILYSHAGVIPSTVSPPYTAAALDMIVKDSIAQDDWEHPLLGGVDGPFWNRFYSDGCTSGECCRTLEHLLRLYNVRAMIIGHTPQSRGISTLCNGQLFIIDTGMSYGFGRSAKYLSYVEMHNPSSITLWHGYDDGVLTPENRHWESNTVPLPQLAPGTQSAVDYPVYSLKSRTHLTKTLDAFSLR